MKIGIVAPSPVPFTQGGAERLWSGLAQAINQGTPHAAEVIKLPTRERSLSELVAAYADFARLDVSHFDVVISGKYPAWSIRHPRHVIYLLHRLRGLYDAYAVPHSAPTDQPEPAELQSFRRFLAQPVEMHEVLEVADRYSELAAHLGEGAAELSFPGPLARDIVRHLDGIGFRPDRIHRYAAISATVASREDYFPSGVPVLPIWPPSGLSGYTCEAFEYFFTASRIDAPKRIDLLIAAMKHVTAGTPLIIAGTGPDLERCRVLAADDPRIQFIGHVSDTELLDRYRGALAVPFVPQDEDLGLITLEAYCSGKPVITCTDSGGATEFVVDGINGFVVAPEPAPLGAAMQKLAEDEELARRMGQSGRARARGVTWRRVTSALLGEPNPSSRNGVVTPPRSQRRRVVVMSTFPIHPRVGGGQIRCYHLYRGLLSTHDVVIVSLDSHGASAQSVEIEPGMTEILVPKSAEHESREQALAAGVGIPVTDIAASRHIGLTPAYAARVRESLSSADAIVMAHAYLLPVVESLDVELPLIYDAQDVAVELKRALLPDTPLGRDLLTTVETVETALVKRASLTVPCAEADAAELTRRYGSAKMMVIGNGTDIEATRYWTAADRRRNHMSWLRRLGISAAADDLDSAAAFIGSAHPPNLEAAERLIAQAPAMPDTLLVLAGGMCSRLVNVARPRNVLLVGEVSDASKQWLLGGVDVGLNPVLRGSGTNLKLIEYFAAGLPVVSTPVGVRGLEDDLRACVDVADIDAFPAAVVAAVDRSGWEVRTAEARAIAAERYDWRRLAERFSEAVTSVLQIPRL